MNNARIDRMLRELDCEPCHQFFATLFGLIGLGRRAAQPAGQPLSFVDGATAR